MQSKITAKVRDKHTVNGINTHGHILYLYHKYVYLQCIHIHKINMILQGVILITVYIHYDKMYINTYVLYIIHLSVWDIFLSITPPDCGSLSHSPLLFPTCKNGGFIFFSALQHAFLMINYDEMNVM